MPSLVARGSTSAMAVIEEQYEWILNGKIPSDKIFSLFNKVI